MARLARRLRKAHPLWPRWKCDLEAKRRVVEKFVQVCDGQEMRYVRNPDFNRHLVSGEPAGASGNLVTQKR